MEIGKTSSFASCSPGWSYGLFSVAAPNLPPGFKIDSDRSIWFNHTKLNQSYYTESQWNELTLGFDFENVQFSDEYFIEVTELRKDEDYTIYYTNWTRLFLMGIIPTFLLIYFNYKVSFWEEKDQGLPTYVQFCNWSFVTVDKLWGIS